MEATSVKKKQAESLGQTLNLTEFEAKVVNLVQTVKDLRSESLSLKEKNTDLEVELFNKEEQVQEFQAEILSLKDKNKDLQGQIKVLESSLVSETKDLEELSQEKIMTRLVVENLLHSIDSLIEVKEN